MPPGAIKAAHGVLYEGESQYQYIDVRERDDGSRVLELNEGVVANSVWYPHSVLTGGEWDMFLVVPPLVPHRCATCSSSATRAARPLVRSPRSTPASRSTASSSIPR